MANSVDPDQTVGAVCSGSTLFASIPNLSVMLDNYLQQTTSADNIFRCIFFLRVKDMQNFIKIRKMWILCSNIFQAINKNYFSKLNTCPAEPRFILFFKKTL